MIPMKRAHCLFSIFLAVLVPAFVHAVDEQRPALAQAFGKARPVVQPQPDGLIVLEGEEFQPQGAAPGWKAGNFGENYYAATFANAFLSRRAFISAPEQTETEVVATLDAQIPAAGTYLALVRYEAAYRFETQFRVVIEQGGKKVFDRLYGARKNPKIWAFSEKVKPEVGWSWGAGENVVWEGHDAKAALQPGRATIRLIAAKQPEPAARRNIDLVMLTTDEKQVADRIDKEKYLPLDGMLTQSGDVFLKVTNKGGAKLTFRSGKGAGKPNWQEHSPYWVHLRHWTSPVIEVEPGKTSDWVEVGGAMDTLGHGQWFWTGDQAYRAEFGLKGPDGKIAPIAAFDGQGDLTLAADCDTRYLKRLRKQDAVLYDLLAYLKAQPMTGKTPGLTPIYAYTFDPIEGDAKHAAAVSEFLKLYGISVTKPDAGPSRGYIDVRSVPTEKLAEYCQEKLGANAADILSVSLGDEIGLPLPTKPEEKAAFKDWVKAQGGNPAETGDYDRAPALRESNPARYYWSHRYDYDFGIRKIKERTDILRQALPYAQIGANFSPHYPQPHLFLGEVHKWASIFRQQGMTMPWSEDYIWQVPVVSPQVNSINLDLFRAGLRKHPEGKIHYYVMPHMPNNTPRMWRRLFYSTVGHGAKIINLFEFRPVHVAYTENHVDEPEMYAEVLKSFREMGGFEDLTQAGQVRQAQTGLWFSETGDIWGDNEGSFGAAKRGLYLAIRHSQTPLDFIIEPDAIDGTLKQYKVLYLADKHVSTAASAKIAEWVEAGGTLFATAGAGMFDELNRPNATLRKLLGIDPAPLEAPEGKQILWIKQDLPFTDPIGKAGDLPVVGVRSRFKLAGAEAGELTFEDGTPAVAHRTVGKGRTTYVGFLPSLAYYQPAVPKRPVDRGATDDAFIHFLPTAFDPKAAALIAAPVAALPKTVECSEAIVETTIIDANGGIVIPLINWSPKAIAGLKVTLRGITGGEPKLASGGKIASETKDGVRLLTFDLDVADALVIKK
jgi:hypothetical protein